MLAENYAYLEERVPVMEQVRKEEPKRQEKTRQLPVRKHHTLRKVLTIGMVLVCFATACFTIFRYAQITENHRAILALEKTLEDENLRKENLKVELAYHKDLNTIEFTATEMGMKYPEEGQVEYVSLPEANRIMEQADASSAQAEPSLWSRFLGSSN